MILKKHLKKTCIRKFIKENTSGIAKITVDEVVPLEKLQSLIEEHRKGLKYGTQILIGTTFNSNKFLICIISCDKNRDTKLFGLKRLG